jgi:hypothetical protein
MRHEVAAGVIWLSRCSPARSLDGRDATGGGRTFRRPCAGPDLEEGIKAVQHERCAAPGLGQRS